MLCCHSTTQLISLICHRHPHLHLILDVRSNFAEYPQRHYIIYTNDTLNIPFVPHATQLHSSKTKLPLDPVCCAPNYLCDSLWWHCCHWSCHRRHCSRSAVAIAVALRPMKQQQPALPIADEHVPHVPKWDYPIWMELAKLVELAVAVAEVAVVNCCCCCCTDLRHECDAKMMKPSMPPVCCWSMMLSPALGWNRKC